MFRQGTQSASGATNYYPHNDETTGENKETKLTGKKRRLKAEKKRKEEKRKLLAIEARIVVEKLNWYFLPKKLSFYFD